MKPKILVIDDEQNIGELLIVNMSNEYEIKSVTDGLSAIELIKGEKFNLILLDIVMPGMYGTRVLEEIRKTLPEIKIIIMSGKSMDADIIDCLIKNKVDACIKKPFEIREIKTIIKERIEKTG